ncbi:MAG: T9SS type A sorting domain-containing protein, partial [Bacteroidetes bacterium]|nr:T9SS type A sorting domain-containing protein [Bacteroidota bacterium]
DTAKVGNWSSSAKNFSAWKTSSSGDASTWCSLASTVIADSLFNSKSTADLSINGSKQAAWLINGKGKAVSVISSVSVDYSGDARATTYGYGTDIGADEFTPTSLPPLCTQAGNITNNDSLTYTFAGRTIARVKWYGSSLPSSLTVRYFSGTNPPDSTNNGTNTGSHYMNAYTQFTATGGTGYEYDGTIYYDEALLGNISSESTIRMAKAPDGGSGAWKVHASSTVDATNNLVRLKRLNSFSSFTVSDNVQPLPISLVTFNAIAQKSDVSLTWQTAAEFGSSHINVLRSIDGKTFEKIAVLKAQGNAFSSTDYNFLDQNATSLQTTQSIYYQLEMVDVNGAMNYSEIQLVSFKKSLVVTSMYPQPMGEQINIQLNVNEASQLRISLIDMSGKLMMTDTKAYQSGQNIVSFSTSELATGMYLIRIENGEDITITKVLKK